MTKQRLDQALVLRGLLATRSQAENLIKLGQVTVNGRVITKPASLVDLANNIELTSKEQYVSRAGLKLASVVNKFKLDFKNKTVLDVGSSTGGFTDYALKHGAERVFAVDVGTNQMHPSLTTDKRVELHEQTDIRDFQKPDVAIDLILIDVSFISLSKIMANIKTFCQPSSLVVAMVKPQFETDRDQLKNRGVIKNEQIRRQIFKDFENRVQKLFKIIEKADAGITGEKGNRERFYLLMPL